MKNLILKSAVITILGLASFNSYATVISVNLDNGCVRHVSTGNKDTFTIRGFAGMPFIVGAPGATDIKVTAPNGKRIESAIALYWGSGMYTPPVNGRYKVVVTGGHQVVEFCR